MVSRDRHCRPHRWDVHPRHVDCSGRSQIRYYRRRIRPITTNERKLGMQAWLNYFEWNRKHRKPIPWENAVQIESHLRAPLIRSLQKFQIGESGEGRKLRRHAAATQNQVYAAAIDLFIQEEQEHARLMAEILKRLDAPLLQ